MRKSMRVFETYVEMMNDDIKAAFLDHNPFAFRHVTHLKSASHFDDVGPCVLMATPSGLQSGASRDAFEAWCDDRRNTVIICDFAVQGTLAREILTAPKDILTKIGVRKQLRCGVMQLSFSAHADYDQTSGFLDAVKPPHVVLVHGEREGMMRLKWALEKAAVEQDIPRALYTPAVMQTVKIQHQPLRVVRVAGSLADKPLQVGAVLQGVLINPLASGTGGAAEPLLLHPDDLPTYTRLHRGRVTQRQALATNLPWAKLRLAMEVIFEGVQGEGTHPVTGILPLAPSGQKGGPQETETVEVGGAVLVTYRSANRSAGYDTHVMVEWEGGKVNDMVADAVVAVLLHATAVQGGSSKAIVMAETELQRARAAGDEEATARAECAAIAAVMAAQFGPTHIEDDEVHVQAGGTASSPASGVPVVITPADGKVVCGDPAVKARIERAVHRMLDAMRPVSLS